VIDDIELGALMSATRRQDLLLATGFVEVQIYHSVAELVAGMQKNVFTLLRYSAWTLVLATLGTLMLSVWPWIGIFVTDGATRWLNAGSVIAALLLHADVSRRMRYSYRSLLFVPFNGAATVLLFWQVAIRTWLQGGIIWRGTHYPLEALKRRKRTRA
jgi:hypothetical protein